MPKLFISCLQHALLIWKQLQAQPVSKNYWSPKSKQVAFAILKLSTFAKNILSARTLWIDVHAGSDKLTSCPNSDPESGSSFCLSY